MKAFIVLFALVAAAYADAEAEADPYLLYGGYNGYAGWGGWTGYAGLPYGAYGYAQNVYGLPHGPYGLTSAVKAVEVAPAKVEVAVKAVAAPVIAAAPAAYTYHHAYAGAPVAYGAYGGYPYAAHLGLAAAPVAAHVVAKREAEADADPAYFYNGWNGYAGYGYAGLGAYGAYGYPYAGVYGARAYAGYPYGAYHGLAAAPSDPTNPHLVHTSRFGICTNYLGAQVSC